MATHRELAKLWNASLQAIVPALYAWAVTVAPAACARGSPLVARWAPFAAVFVLLGGAAIEPWVGRSTLVRSLTFSGFVLFCALAWASAVTSHANFLDGWRAVAGVLGWALVGLAAAGPSRVREGPRVMESAGPASWWRHVYLWVAAAAATWTQVIGWRAATAERALLVRFIGLAAGLGVLGASADLAVFFNAPPNAQRARDGLRASLMPLGVGLALLFARWLLADESAEISGRPLEGLGTS